MATRSTTPLSSMLLSRMDNQYAHVSGQVALELAGLDGADLPTLAAAHGVDPGNVILVKPAE